MRIFIITMDDPLYTIQFFKEIIEARQKSIVGLAVTSGDRMKISKNRSRLTYIFSLLLIMGPSYFITNSLKTLSFKIKKYLSQKITSIKSPSIIEYAKQKGIKTFVIKTPNDKAFLTQLKDLSPDVIINQSQHILKSALLEVPKLGVLNRHNALLPKNRGRLTPFWVLYNQEKETGVSIHFVNEGIDSGDIIVQKKYEVVPGDTFKSIVNKNYKIAGKAMLEALNLIESGDFRRIYNSNEEATYNSTPSFKDALTYRVKRILK